jgi:hypothetical protein
MKRTDIYLTETQYQAVKHIAADKGVTFSEMFRRIVDRYLEESSCQTVSNVINQGVQTNSVQSPVE